MGINPKPDVDSALDFGSVFDYVAKKQAEKEHGMVSEVLFFLLDNTSEIKDLTDAEQLQLRFYLTNVSIEIASLGVET